MRNIILLGLVSFFSDISAEMVYPIIPLYLTAVLGATPALVGLVEGIAESVASLLRVYSGYLTDRYQNKKALAFTGYAAGLFYKFLLLVAGSWTGVLLARVVDRVGKGMRVAPRDVLVSESADKEHMGNAFGIHKALDMAGAAIGIFIAFFMLEQAKAGDFNYRQFFLLSLIPAVVGLGVLLMVKEKKQGRAEKRREPFWQRLGEVSGDLKLYLLVTFLFTLGNSSNAFLLLRAQNLGWTAAGATLLYFLYHVVASLLSVPFGRLSDRIGRKKVLVTGYLVFSAVYFAFALARSQYTLAAIFLLYGFYTAMITGTERAMISEIAPPALKGTMLGLQSTLQGVALLPASIIAGQLWVRFGATAPFYYGGALSLAAALLLLFLLNRPAPPATRT